MYIIYIHICLLILTDVYTKRRSVSWKVGCCIKQVYTKAWKKKKRQQVGDEQNISMFHLLNFARIIFVYFTCIVLQAIFMSNSEEEEKKNNRKFLLQSFIICSQVYLKIWTCFNETKNKDKKNNTLIQSSIGTEI